jgi:hypothetical protein
MKIACDAEGDGGIVFGGQEVGLAMGALWRSYSQGQWFWQFGHTCARLLVQVT